MAGTVVVGPSVQVLEVMFFDMAGRDLACAHMTVRHRGAGWTLRLPVAGDSRDGVRAPGTNRRRRHAELARLVPTLTLAANLRRVAMMTCRRWWWVLDADGVLAADVGVDRVCARWVSGDSPLAWREIEVEAR